MGEPVLQHGYNLVFLLAINAQSKCDEVYQTICPESVNHDCTYFDMH